MRTSDSTLGFAVPPPSLAGRQPLTALPLSRFVPGSIASAGSPRSLAPKRPAPSTPGTPERLDDSGRTVAKKRSWRTVTPREHAILARDDLGVGKSPARRLFCQPDSASSSSSKSTTIFGISGATPVSSSSRSLAPSPPIAESSSMATASASSVPWSAGMSPSPSGRTRFLPPATVEGENGVMLNAHYPGFDIYDDATLPDTYSAPTTPSRSAIYQFSKRGTPSAKSRTPSRSASTTAPSSPASSDPGTPRQLENQENIPPVPLHAPTPSRATPSSKLLSPRSSPIKTAYSVRSTASLSTVSIENRASDSSRGGEDMDEDEDDCLVADMLGASAAVVVSSGAGGTGRRRTGKSKLDQVFAGHEPSDDDDDSNTGLPQELTPGRVREPLSVAKERMLLEVDDV